MADSGDASEDERQRHRERRRDAHLQAAVVHDRSALCHDVAAERFERLQHPGLAARARDTAQQERHNAEIARQRALAELSSI